MQDKEPQVVLTVKLALTVQLEPQPAQFAPLEDTKLLQDRQVATHAQLVIAATAALLPSV
ncbi:hypothetical protein DPMN_115103 [Dreissena polymorpha]|uniref:Uncharacterized protein n=1 Tax=Dreissena polymorpha TaxID=45954 RepID=A0A9D4KL94_DREPO|nr:hypothetical protein DPMN_115103 [Dreissena polymorpha]